MSRSSPRTTARPFERLLARITTRWRRDAEILHRRGGDEQAAVLESCVADLEEEARTYSLEALTVGQAANESGYSYGALQKMVSEGTIPNVGKKGAPRIRRGDLPKKPGSSHESSKSEPDLAELVLAGKGTPSHIP